MDNNDAQLREQARNRSQEKIAFYTHFVSYVIVNAGLVTINLLVSPGNLWFYWPLLGWGIGLTMHGVITLAKGTSMIRGMEEREYQKIKRKQGR